MSKRSEIEAAIASGHLPRATGEAMLKRLPAGEDGGATTERVAPEIHTEIQAFAAPEIQEPPAAPAPPPTAGPTSQSLVPILVQDPSANWRIIAAVLSGCAALVALIRACI